MSLNENPFPPLPAVRSALVRAIDVANRYPEFLPVRLRRLIASHIGVCDEQVVLGAGASGVVMQVLHAVTRPGDRIVFSEPTFDGYPIFTEMARLTSVTVPLDKRGHHNLGVMAEAAADARVVVLCRPHNPTGTLEPVADVHRFLRRVPSDTIVLLDEAYIEFVAPQHRIDGPDLIRRFPNVVVLRHLLEGLRIGRASYRVRLRVTRTGKNTMGDAIAVRHGHYRLGRRGGVLRRRRPVAATHSAYHW